MTCLYNYMKCLSKTRNSLLSNTRTTYLSILIYYIAYVLNIEYIYAVKQNSKYTRINIHLLNYIVNFTTNYKITNVFVNYNCKLQIHRQNYNLQFDA